tara:strand:- start:23 stop:820 length:798 start_codon:yes stop_codon:yes gene_type:complete
MANIQKVQKYFRITTKLFNHKKRENRSILWAAYKGLLGGLRGRALDPIKYCVSDKFKLVYIVNSKAGCTSIKQALMSSSGDDVNGDNYWDVHKASAEKGYVKSTLSEIEKEYFFFTFVRSPFSRVASLYLNKFCHQQNISQRGFGYKRYLGGVLDRNDSFEKFVTKISKIPDILCDRHFKPQAYLINKESEKIDFIGKFENFNDDYERLRKDFHLKKLNVVNKSSDYSLSDIYTHTTLDLVAKRYEEDIEQFGYADEYDKIKAML